MMPASYNSVGVPSSAGYPVYSGLINPIFAKAFTMRMYAETVHGQITSTSVVPSELRNAGDLAVFRRPPRGQVFKYNKNQDLDVSHFNSSTFSFRVDKAWYINIKLDKLDLKQIPEIRQWIKMFMDDSLEQLGAQIDHDILQTMVADAHHCNKGNRAGVRTHAFRLGQVGAPLALEAGGAINPLTLTAVMRAVLAEQNIRSSRDTFVVWPTAVESLFLANPVLANACMSGLSQSTLITGTVAPIQGVKHLFSANMPTYRDPVTNEVTYPVIMGLRSATGYVQQMRDNEIITQDPRSFSQYFRALFVAGWGVLEPCQLVVAYVTVRGLF
jgi:hypothetical protein